MKKSKLTEKDKKTVFPYENFPVKVLHKEGNDFKTCYFQNESYAKKYTQKLKAKKIDFEIYVNKKD